MDIYQLFYYRPLWFMFLACIHVPHGCHSSWHLAGNGKTPLSCFSSPTLDCFQAWAPSRICQIPSKWGQCVLEKQGVPVRQSASNRRLEPTPFPTGNAGFPPLDLHPFFNIDEEGPSPILTPLLYRATSKDL
ncbi:hypothetical protein B0J14DRAFT_273696 [Halenospora varia]|nr:hypothetical protein B0J14DRAFT_273696 [Halenospora varia]